MTEAAIPSDEQLVALRQLCEGEVTFHSDGWRRLVLMLGLRIRTNVTCDALICLNHDNPSYPTKLYLPERLPNSSLNWNEQAYILGRNWVTFSWSNVPSQLPLIEILAAHLAPLNQGQAA